MIVTYTASNNNVPIGNRRVPGTKLIYRIPYYFLIKQKRCPICNGRQFDKAINFKKSRRVKRKR